MHIKIAHRKALESSNKRLYEVQQLQDQLEDADLRVQQAAIREQVLMEGLQLREERIAQLEIKQLELTTRWEHETQQREVLAAELALTEESHTEELERLKAEVEQLRAELERAKEASQQAEARCQLLEERLSEAEERAETGQEAREAGELEAAQRAAAEARAVADELRRQLEDVQDKRRPAYPDDLAKIVKNMEEEERRRNEERRQFATTTTPEAMVRVLRKLQAKKGDSGVYDLGLSIGRWTPGETVREVCALLWQKGYKEMAADIAGHLSAREDLESLADFLIQLGGHDASRMANSLVERTLSQFAWFRESEDIPLFMDMLRERGWTAWAAQLEEECAVRRDPDKLAELLSTMGIEEREVMLTSICNSRSTADVPALLSEMSSIGLETEIHSLVAQIEATRPIDYPIIVEAWELANQ